MKIKNLFLLPALLTSLTVLSTSCYGDGASGQTAYNSNGNGNNGNMDSTRSSTPSKSGKATLPNTSSAYSGSTGTNGGSNPSTNGSLSSKGYTNGSTSSYTNGGNACSTMDISVFEETDEENAYSNYGFTRGDIKNLYIYKYDPKSEQTISGNVEKMLRVQFPDGNCYFIAVVRTDSGDILVNLGPVWFADENNLVINEGDAIQVMGSLVRTNGRFILIASQLKKNGQMLQLRNQSGNPQWGSPKSQKGTNSY